MSKLTNSKKIKLLKIEQTKAIISEHLKSELITEDDIISLFNKDINYGLVINKEKTSYKECLLKEIYNCPFLLCDQEYLGSEVKDILPLFIDKRYKIESKNLYYYYKEGYISLDEYTKELDELIFVYYKLSDGKKILREQQLEKVKTI